MKKFLLLAAVLMLAASGATAQPAYKWTTVQMDSSFDAITDSTATMIIAKYAPLVGSLQEIVGYSDAEYEKHRPESGLSNFAADIIRETGEKLCGSHVDVGLTNFGGIRTNLPKGAVRIYDIYSIFPFDNSLLVFDIKGSDLLTFFRKQARKPEALSGVRFDVVNGEIKTLLVGGEPIDPDKIYKFATIDFLMDGGDGVQLKDFAMNVQKSGRFLRDIIIDYIKDMTARGQVISLKPDGRVTVVKPQKKEGSK